MFPVYVCTVSNEVRWNSRKARQGRLFAVIGWKISSSILAPLAISLSLKLQSEPKQIISNGKKLIIMMTFATHPCLHPPFFLFGFGDSFGAFWFSLGFLFGLLLFCFRNLCVFSF